MVGKGLPIHGGTPVPCMPTVTPRKQSTASQHHSDRTQRSPISHGTAPRSADPKAVGTQKQPHSTLHPKNRRTPRHAPKTAAPRKRLHTASHPDSRGTPGAATPRALPSRRRPTNQPHPNSEAPLGAPQVGPHPAPPQKTRPPPPGAPGAAPRTQPRTAAGAPRPPHRPRPHSPQHSRRHRKGQQPQPPPQPQPQRGAARRPPAMPAAAAARPRLSGTRGLTSGGGGGGGEEEGAVLLPPPARGPLSPPSGRAAPSCSPLFPSHPPPRRRFGSVRFGSGAGFVCGSFLPPRPPCPGLLRLSGADRQALEVGTPRGLGGGVGPAAVLREYQRGAQPPSSGAAP